MAANGNTQDNCVYFRRKKCNILLRYVREHGAEQRVITALTAIHGDEAIDIILVYNSKLRSKEFETPLDEMRACGYTGLAQ